MAVYEAQIETPRPPEEVFAYLATFSNAAEWDPGVADAEMVSSGPVGHGSVFRLTIPLAGRPRRFDYEIVEFDPPRKVVLRAETPLLRSVDTILVEPGERGARVRYTAQLTPRGVLGIADPLLARQFQKIGDRAIAGLRERLA